MALEISADYRLAAAVCRAYNDYMLESWLAHSDYCIGAITVERAWVALEA